jgi:hypothetical protein
MALSCSYIPHNKRGEELKGFQTYRKELGYQTAAKVFTAVLSPSFKEQYKKTLVLDTQGVPTYESAAKIEYIKKLIGTDKLMKADQKKFPKVENSRENYQRLILSAHSYNQSNDNRDSLVAVVTQTPDNMLQIEVRERNEQNVNEYESQYSTQLLNQKLEGLLGDLGITVDLLENYEMTNGYVDFSKADSIADGFEGLIKVANGMQGELALSEEFAHLLVGMFYNQPLIQRNLRLLADNPRLIEEVLGDEYEQNRAYYEQNPNRDAFGNEIPLEDTLAEEALGRILQDKLATSPSEASEENSSPLNSLIHRLLSYLKRMFRGRNADDIQKARNEVSATMGELAKNVLSGTQQLKTEELIKNRRNARFNHLRDANDKVLALLKNANEIERKRSKIAPKEQQKAIRDSVIKLESLMTDIKKMEGLHTYAKWALQDLQDAMDKLDISGTLNQQNFTVLRHIKSVLDSYEGFISDFHEVLDDMGDDFVVTINGEDVNLRELWREIDDLYKSCDTAFKNQAFAAFSDFLAPIYEKSPLRNADGSTKSLEDVLAGEDFDISEFDRWCTSMGESSSVLLQLFDKVVKNAKDKVRLNTIHNIRDIWKLRENAEKRGITSFEWMFEKDDEGHKTGNYISPYNHGQFKKDEEEMQRKLIEKYGKQPIGEDFKKAFLERKAWYETHATKDMFGNSFPGDMYKNPEFDRLSAAQKETLNEILRYKDQLEMQLPADRRSRVRAIQRRRSGTQRLIDSATNPTNAFAAIKEDLKSAFSKSEDDDLLYGETTKGLTDFTGQEYMTLPILYTNRLKNPDTLSTDIFSDLMAYAYAANTYDQMSKVYDPLEIGVSVTAQKEFVKNAGSKTKEEVLNVLGRVTKKSIKVGSNTNFAKKLRDYLECQVYGRYMKEDDVLGVNAQKTLGVFQKLTSMAYLGCNYLAGVANIATAYGMQNIEAAAGEFFNHKQLLSADKEYAAMLPEFIAELGSREKQSKLALFDELFDVRQNAKDKLHNTQMKNIFRRFFGNNWMFVQQGLGDHWIYNRTAIAMAKKKKVKVNGREMSVWDALEIVTDDNGYKYMQPKKGTKNLDGSDFDAGQFAIEIAHINHTIGGMYNDDDQNAANRVMLGRLAMQMRKWIIPQMMRRFQGKRMILDIGREEEGYYRTAGRLAMDLWKGGFKLTAEWEKLNDSEKANVRRAITEMAQTYALWILCTCLGSGVKDPDRSWAMKFAEYMLHREVHELGFLTPGPMMLTEGYKTVTSPFVAASAANKLAQAMVTTINPANWFPDDSELIQSGRYEGHSYLYKRWAELPLPPFTQLRQIEKFMDDLDTGTKYYAKDYK